MTFDTGTGAGTFHLDSTFVAQYAKDLLNKHPDGSAQGGSAWSMNSTPIFGFHTNHIVKIGTTNLGYDHIAISDKKGYFNNPNMDGALNIPENDTTHVWELNFDYNYLEIHSAKDFKMPMDCFVFPMEKDEINHYPFIIQMPVKIEFAEGDTLTINQMFMIDTGLPGDIALMSNAKELSFFNERDDAVWIAFLSSYYRYYTVKAKLFDSYSVDSLRIYTHDYPNRIRCNYLIGLNFLKRFNVFFDMKERQIGLQPVKNFQRVVNPNVMRFHFCIKRDIAREDCSKRSW